MPPRSQSGSGSRLGSCSLPAPVDEIVEEGLDTRQFCRRVAQAVARQLDQ
ncbi:MAG TPA: hypothetical protein VJQ46_04310 [Gemmatimonadales bacterium]|nr:hypothetical protein [Gemmatimonadales bacterium]